MRIDAADILVLGGILMTIFGAYQLNHWSALILGGAYFLLAGLWIGRITAMRTKRTGES